MKKLRLLLLFLTVLFSSCSLNSINKYPSINFIGGKDIIDQDVLLKPNETFKIGINSHTTSDYNIFKFRLLRISDNQVEIVIDSIVNDRIFNTIFTLPTSESDNVERWVFSITCSDGYTSEISAQVTTSDTLKNIQSNNSKVNRYSIIDLPNNNRNILFLFISIIVLSNLIIFLYFKKIYKNKSEDKILKTNIKNK